MKGHCSITFLCLRFIRLIFFSYKLFIVLLIFKLLLLIKVPISDIFSPFRVPSREHSISQVLLLFYDFILFMILFQIAQGLICIFLGTQDINNSEHHEKADLGQNISLGINLAVVVINIMLNTMEMSSTKVPELTNGTDIYFNAKTE